ncbi:tRNA pseudouridine(38-40) synthase TruA [Urechidicola sp. KH5]
MRYFIELSYNGKDYHGWQIQPNAISVQEVLEDRLSKIVGVETAVVAAGRTDAGVHASQMFAHFNAELIESLDRLQHKLNSFLPDTIVVHAIRKVNDHAHARFDATARSYEYHIFLGRNAFNLETTWQIHHSEIDVEAMNKAAAVLLQYNDFQCFSKSKTDVKTYVCKITEVYWKQDGNHLIFYITADRFLRNMVRAIVGTLIDVGLNKISTADVHAIIKSKNRSEAGFSVPAKGLFLTNVSYPSSIFKNE